MPIYAYKCESCGHRQDVLRKISDPLLTACPACGASTFVKQVTAAGFQLKGSGWYVTDFRDGGGGSKPAGGEGAAKPDTASTPAPAGKGDAAAPAAAAAGTSGTAASSDGGSSSPAPSGGCGSSCACH